MINETEFAQKIVSVLESGTQSIDAATAAHLAAARQQAVAAMAQPVHAATLRPILAGWHHVVEFSHLGGYRFWLPVLLLLVALAAAVSSTLTTNGHEPIDTDALLLASELPPEAYADKEFVAWLEHSSQL
ncbi:MAG TPA: DUF3619 family protein [Novimethylophilus sp.]|jgi:putative copper export protein|uniref:DUF3619 family protein n=1 Tax=Novimethylophilus sp. TaxID=2137426 RepID=UPI002F401C7E